MKQTLDIINQRGLSGKYTKMSSTFQSDVIKLSEPYINADVSVPVTQRIWHIINKRQIPRCKMCLNTCQWNSTTKNYRTYCSLKCVNLDSSYIGKTRKPTDYKKSIKKTKETMLARYGHDSFFATEQFKTSHIPHRRQLTDIDKKKLVDGRAEQRKHKDYIPPMRTPQSLIKYRNTSICRLNIPNVSDEETLKSYLMELNRTERKNCVEIAAILNVHTSTVCRWFDMLDLEIVNHYSSSEQKEVAEYITSLGFEVKQNVRSIISGELDIVIESKNIAIEHCGLYWHSDVHKHNNYHKDKLDKCTEKGIRLITLFQNEWVWSKEQTKDKLAHILGVSSKPKIYARATKPFKASYKEVKEFLNTNHIQGASNGSNIVALSYNDEIVACMVFKKVNNDTILLNRYAATNVVGGFSKLLKFATPILKSNNYKTIVTFADLRWSDGAVYKKNGFEPIYTIKPDYSYIRNSKLYHKFNFRHSKLKKLKGYDATLSELLNTQKMNIHRIYDCGKIKYATTL